MRLYGDIEERALAKLAFTDFCWTWTGCRNAAGYAGLQTERLGGPGYVDRMLAERAGQLTLERT